jgi:hypothetical protein
MLYNGRQDRPKDLVTQDQLTALGTTFRVETIAATSVGQTAFTVPNGFASASAILVLFNGVLQQPSDYTATSPTVTLASGATATTDVMSVVVFGTVRAQDDALLSYTVAQLNSMGAANNTRKSRWCSDMAGRAGPVYSDGTNWRRYVDDTIVST